MASASPGETDCSRAALLEDGSDHEEESERVQGDEFIAALPEPCPGPVLVNDKGEWIGVPTHEIERLQLIESKTISGSVVLRLADDSVFSVGPIRNLGTLSAYRDAKYVLMIGGELRPVQRRQGALQYWTEG